MDKIASNIPIVINNRNRLTPVIKMIDHLNRLGYSRIFILDNDSTYPPLLEWYKTCKAQVQYIGENMGHQALWKHGILNMFKKHPFIVYTDSDIELNPNTPEGFIETLIILAKDYRAEKAGLAIHYQDIPPSLGNDRSRLIEERYWKKRLAHPHYEVYDAYIDTTFAVVKSASTYSWAHKAVRVAGEFTCRHTPWYLDYNNLNQEEQYYIDNANEKFCSYKRLMK
jgi:hypothetical protein